MCTAEVEIRCNDKKKEYATISQPTDQSINQSISIFLREASTNSAGQNVILFLQKIVHDGDVKADRNGARLPV